MTAESFRGLCSGTGSPEPRVTALWVSPPPPHTHPWRWTWSAPPTARSAAVVLSAEPSPAWQSLALNFPLLDACPALQQRKGLSEGQPPPLKGQDPAPPPSAPPAPLGCQCPGAWLVRGQSCPTALLRAFWEKGFCRRKRAVWGMGGCYGVSLGTSLGPAPGCLLWQCGRTAPRDLPKPPAPASREWRSLIPGTCFQPWGAPDWKLSPF